MILEHEIAWGSKPPDYVEAYPRLSAIEARRAARAGQTMCLWFEGPRLIASAYVRLDENSGLVITLADNLGKALGEARHVGEYAFEVVSRGSKENNQRPLLVCPRCRLARSSLAFKAGVWLCQRCHGLGYRSTRIGSDVRWAEKYRDLRAELDQLIEDKRRSDLIRRATVAVVKASARAGPKPHPVANRNYVTVVKAVWQKGEFRRGRHRQS